LEEISFLRYGTPIQRILHNRSTKRRKSLSPMIEEFGALEKGQTGQMARERVMARVSLERATCGAAREEVDRRVERDLGVDGVRATLPSNLRIRHPQPDQYSRAIRCSCRSRGRIGLLHMRPP
jgi:hypothetical protein